MENHCYPALEEIAKFRGKLAHGAKPIIVFVHPPKLFDKTANVADPVIFEGGCLLPFIRLGSEESAADNNYVPSGGFTPISLSLLASILKRKGFESTILELSHCKNPVGAITAVKQKLSDLGYAIVWGFTATSPSNHCAMSLASTVKGEGSLVFFGGSHATTCHRFAIRNCPQLDFIFVGEAEKSMPELVDFIVNEKGPSLEMIKGVTFRGQNGFVFGENIRQQGDEISFPDFEFLSNDSFPDIWGKKRAFRVQSARGCKYRCTFCAQAIQLQVSGLEKLGNYIIYLSEKSNSGKINIFFEDATFTSDRERTLDFCSKVAELKKMGITVSWGCQTRADCLDGEIISAISAAGCIYVYIGVESLNSESLKLVRKSVNYVGFASPSDKIENTLGLLRKHGVKVGCSIIVGLPTDTVDNFAFTVSRLADLGVHMVFLESVKLFPMTRLSDSVSQDLSLRENEVVEKYYSEIKNPVSNPEDTNCYLMCEPEKLELFYSTAKWILLEKFDMVSEGCYIRKKQPSFEPIKLFCNYRFAIKTS